MTNFHLNFPAASPQPVMCEVCGTYFETRRGLSSHARLHLRQLGVTVSESSGAPIELLYQLIQERDGSLPNFKADSSAPASTNLKNPTQQESKVPSAQEDKTASLKAVVMTTQQKMDHQGSPAKLKESAATLLPSSPSALMVSEGGSTSSVEHQPKTKPLWAPLETDAPITLGMAKSINHPLVCVCQLCGCWYETRKGLSSHARAHLRQIGIPDSEIKGSPIDFLYQVMAEEDLKPISSEQQEQLTSDSPSRSSSKRPSDLSSPPASPFSKRLKTSEECTCILCGEEFENRKGLASHARSHLRQIGVTDLLGKSSAIDTIQELVTSASPAAPPLSPASSGQSLTPFPSASLSPSSTKSALSPQTPGNRAPKAKKGYRLAVDPLHRKPKPEPVEVEVSVQPKASSTNSSSLTQRSPDPVAAAKPQNSPPSVLCDYCGQLFDTRKALSCHARAHLRQLGLTWSIRTSPIDLLKEVMTHGEEGRKVSSVSGKATWTPQGSKKSRDNTSCELCGFDFENRKALASHARAHLRQLGLIEWKADGVSSPIELLSDLIRKDPVKVAAITQRYRTGDLYIKKVEGICLKKSHSYLDTHRDSQQASRTSSSIPALLPKPPLTPLVKVVGKLYYLKCRFCEEVFHGPLSVQEQWITHLQNHILSLGYKGKASPPAAPVTAPALVHPVAV
uniref:WIZ zinc finger a n=1 Tax=Mastacembelus armatus TaxID=205130 RepID=A0A3Q3LF89_9TELE